MLVSFMSRAWSRFIPGLSTSVLLVACSASAQAHPGCVLEVENVKRYANSIPSLLDFAEKRFSEDRAEDISSVDGLLRPIVTKNFEGNSIFAKLESELKPASCDDAELVAIAKRIADANDQLAGASDSTGSSQAALSQDKIQKLEALADTMVLPALAAENSVAGAAINTALQAYFTEKPEALAKQSASETQKTAEEAVANLRGNPGNLGPFDPQAAKGNLTAQLTWILSTLPESDIIRLSEFYASAEAKADREKLIEIYRQEIDQRSSTMLSESIEAFKPHLASKHSASNTSASP